MGLLISLLYITLAFLSPPDIIPALAPYRIVLITVSVAFLISVPMLTMSRVTSLASHQFWLLTLFILWTLASWLPHRWLAGTLLVAREFLPEVTVYYLALLHLRGIGRLKMLRAVLVLTTLFILA